MPVTSVPTSLATVAMATFITEVSRVIRNWPAASVSSTIGIAAGQDPCHGAAAHHLERMTSDLAGRAWRVYVLRSLALRHGGAIAGRKRQGVVSGRSARLAAACRRAPRARRSRRARRGGAGAADRRHG